MRDFFHKLQEIYTLSAPYSRVKLVLMFLLALAQGLLQVVGVTSIFPFLALAASPETFMGSSIGVWILSVWPSMTETQLLMLAGAFAIISLAVSNGMLLFGEVARTRYVAGLGHWMRQRLLTRMLGNPYHYFLQHNTGDLLKKSVGDVLTFINGILAPLMDLIARIILVLLLIGLLFLVNPVLTLLAAGGMGLFYIGIYLLLGPLRKYTSEKMKIANRGAMRLSIQALSGVKPIKVHNAELSFIERFGTFSAQQARLQKWIPFYSNAPRYFIEPLAFGGIIVVILYYVATNKPLNELLPGLGVMALAGYRMLPNIQLIYGAFSGISLSSHALEEIREEMRQIDIGFKEGNFVPKELIQPLTWEDKIELRSLTFTYQNATKPVLDSINLTFSKNQFVAVIGETGSGKSTLIDIILGLHHPQSGSLLVDGVELSADSIRSWRAGIGYVPQDIFLADDTIEANIAFGIAPDLIDRNRVREVAEAAQLTSFIEGDLPDGFKTQTGERGVRVSGGQKQRIGLARALYHRPNLLILDEATSALDNETETAMMEAINALSGQLTIIAIAHRLTTIRKAQTVVSLKKGRVDEIGTYDELVGSRTAAKVDPD